jgi:glycosyltransferase involved in cell wall biosynthesis
MPDVQYVAVGLPTLRDEFERLAEELGVADHVSFVGCVARDRLLEYLNCCDLFVMTSRHASNQFEGFGISVVEAALCGKPAVVSANSGLLEAIVDGKTGLAVPEGDETATANAILRLLAGDGERLRMGEAALARALAHQTWQHRARQYDRVFRDFIRPISRQSSLSLGTAPEVSER